MAVPTDERTLIPPTGLVRTELARALREVDRLKALLKLAIRADEDKQYLADVEKGGADYALRQITSK